MPTKKGAGGRQQNYNPRNGRFAKTNYTDLCPQKPLSRKEKARKREENRRAELFNRAKNSRDPLLFDVFCEIERNLPGTVQHVNENKFDPFLGKERELDICTKKCIIEVKSGSKPKGALRQFLGQKQFAESKNKYHIVFAPAMPAMAKSQHRKNGITVTGNIEKLISFIKEHEQ